MSKGIERDIIMTARATNILRTKLLKQSEYEILWNLMATLPATGDVVSHADIGRAIDTAPAHVSTAIKRLCEIGFLLRGKKTGTSYHYKLNSEFFQ